MPENHMSGQIIGNNWLICRRGQGGVLESYSSSSKINKIKKMKRVFFETIVVTYQHLYLHHSLLHF